MTAGVPRNSLAQDVNGNFDKSLIQSIAPNGYSQIVLRCSLLARDQQYLCFKTKFVSDETNHQLASSNCGY